MSVIFRFEYRAYRLPLRQPVRTAHGALTEREGVLVRLEDASGGFGYGEAAPLAGFNRETISEVRRDCAALGAQVARGDPRVESVVATLRMALAEAAAELEAAPANAGPDHRAVAALLPAGRAALAQLAPRAEIGFRVFKWKVGIGDLADELALLDDVCAGLPEGARLRLDANGAWDRRAAERWLERCAERPVEYVEQPIAADARGAEDLLSGLAADYPTPLALDESLVIDADVERWLQAGWPGMYVVKPTLLGNVAEALSRLSTARARVVFSSALETAVGARAALRHAFAWSGERLALGFGVWPLFADRRFDGPAAAPFVRFTDVQQLDPAALWNALS